MVSALGAKWRGCGPVQPGGDALQWPRHQEDGRASLQWFEKAAEQGHADAQYNTGMIYAVGALVPQDLPRAAKWLDKSANQGNAAAQSSLGFLYANGQE